MVWEDGGRETPSYPIPVINIGDRNMMPSVERKGMLTQGNAHLGPLLHTFSLPAFSTCPGATLACLLVCYALQFLFYVRTNLTKHKQNWERSEEPVQFAKDMIAEIRWKVVQILRIHVAGDFFGVAYIRAWIKIAKACKRVKFLLHAIVAGGRPAAPPGRTGVTAQRDYRRPSVA